MRIPTLSPGFRKHYLRPFRRLLSDSEAYHRSYDPRSFFDQFHGLTTTRDDRLTISPDFPELDSRFHYNAVENVILSHLKQSGLAPDVMADVGSGTGHWVDFFLQVFDPSRIYAVDISEVAARKLEERFRDRPEVEIRCSDVLDLRDVPGGSLDLISSIGVIFHIVSDQRWEATVRRCWEMLRPGGIWVVSGLMGWVTANVQFEPSRFDSVEEYKHGGGLVCNKRVRSRRYWRRVLARSGFRSATFTKTRIPAHIHSPENNLLFARK